MTKEEAIEELFFRSMNRKPNEYGFLIIENHPSAGKMDLKPTNFAEAANKLDITEELEMLGLVDEHQDELWYQVFKDGLYKILTGSWPGEE